MARNNSIQYQFNDLSLDQMLVFLWILISSREWIWSSFLGEDPSKSQRSLGSSFALADGTLRLFVPLGQDKSALRLQGFALAFFAHSGWDSKRWPMTSEEQV